MKLKKRNGQLESIDKQKLLKCAERACKGLSDVDYEEVTEDAYKQLFNGASVEDVEKALILSARAKIEFEPNYSYVAARLLAQSLYRQTFNHKIVESRFEEDYRKAFINNIVLMVNNDRLSPEFLSLDLEKISQYLKLERDRKFKYLGFQTLYDRYFIHLDGRRLETPQAFFMRVAIGLCIGEAKREFYNNEFPYEKCFQFYDLISSFKYMPSTPTLFNSGTIRSQMSSCYGSTMEDSIDGIFGTLHEQSRLSKFAGGLGVDVTPLRGTGAYIKGTNGPSQGLIPWIKCYNDMALAVNQGSKRKGALAVYCEPWHIDIEEYLDLLKNTGDDRRRAHDIHTALWTPDLFLQKVEVDEDWYLFCPGEAGQLHEVWGEEFNKLYNEFINKAKNGELKQFKKIKAKDLWKKILKSLSETGHPWITFKDTANECYMQLDQGIIHQTQLCTEIFRHNIACKYNGETGKKTKVGETFVCNLASINANEYTTDDLLGKTDVLEKDIHLMIEMLDNVPTNNYYPIESAYNSNTKHRPVGLGLMGFQDFLHKLKISYNDYPSEYSSLIQENIAFDAIKASIELAKQRGTFETYKTSDWAKGIFPHEKSQCNATPTKDWENLRKELHKYGIRNASLMAIAPTATISYITGCRQSIEPDFSVLYVYSTLSGDFTLIDEYFVARCKELGIWTKKLLKQIKSVNGDISELDLPKELQQEFPHVFKVDYNSIIECAASRQKWIDMGQSLNLYSNKNSMKYLSNMYMKAWKSKLKSTYYLRGEAASKTEKSTVEKEKQCSIQAKLNGEICESCT